MDAASPWPCSDATFDAVALDASHSALLADVARVVRPGGRILAPVQAPVPAGCEELARDATEWVAQVTATISRPVPLQRSTVRV
jgi:protein-L-isoaspartate O-methyltransferase